MKALNAEGAPAALGPYSHAVVSGGLVWLSGQLGLDPATGELGATVEEQTERAAKNLAAALEAAGSSLDRVVKTTCFLSDLSLFARFNETYAKFFVSKPARSCVQAAALPKGALVEIDVVAEIGR